LPQEGGPGINKRPRYAFSGSEEAERELIETTLLRAGGNKSLTARKLGMARNTLRLKLVKFGLD
jgi:DNA-binding NtrC family response regulator